MAPEIQREPDAPATRLRALVRAAAATIAFGLNIGSIFASDSVPQIVAKTKPATIQIIALDENWSPIKTGTGFFISPDGLAVTHSLCRSNSVS